MNPSSRPVLTTVAIVSAAVIGFLAYTSLAPSSSASLTSASSPSAPLPNTTERMPHRDAPDDDASAVAKLDPDLLRALQDAAADAADDGASFHVNSGWRSKEYQSQLLHEAISKYGSEAEAARWVATPETSPHVSGDAVDIGPTDGMSWLSIHGAAYGLCQIYGNEPWHYELRPRASDQGCPAMYADPTQDPRMQR